MTRTPARPALVIALFIALALLPLGLAALAGPARPEDAFRDCVAPLLRGLTETSHSGDPAIVALGAVGADAPWWADVLKAIARRDNDAVVRLYSSIPAGLGNDARASRLLTAAQDAGFEVPESLKPRAQAARADRDALRATSLKIGGNLSAAQKNRLTNLLTLVGIRRSAIERLFERAKGAVRLGSNEYEPIIRAGWSADAKGDEARLLVAAFNHDVAQPEADVAKSLEALESGLFRLYQQRAEQIIDEPWIVVDGKPATLGELVAAGAYHQPELHPTNKWMTVGRLSPETVRNPQMKSKGLTRELWWNREKGIEPIGSTRIARNMRVHPDGTEEVVSVEVIRRGSDGIWTPYLYEPDASGKLRLIDGPQARGRTLGCFACHYRLNGLFFGGISMPGYVASPEWYINNIDRVQYRYHAKFEGLRRP